MQNVNMNKLVVGCGYLGQRVANVWRNEGSSVYVVTRKPDRANRLSDSGFIPIIADVTKLDSFDLLPEVSTVLFAVGFDRTSGDTIHDVYVSGLQRTLDALAASIPGKKPRFVYISSTGVYGQSSNEWVDEHSTCEPKREGGRACLAAENLLAEHAIGANRIILRLAGIYGPDRVPRLADVKENRPLPVNGDSYLNLIHVDDASAIVASAENIVGPKMMLVADGHPVLRREFYQYAANLLDVSVEFTDAPADASARQRSKGGKRCRVDLMKRQLDYELRFPTYRHGLDDILSRS